MSEDVADAERRLIAEAVRSGTAKAALAEFGAALDYLEREYTEAWKGTRFDDDDGRQRLWQAVQIVGKVRSHLSNIAAGEGVAVRHLDELRRLGEKRRPFGVV